MTAAIPVSLRAVARSTPLEERKRRQALAERSTHHALLSSVLSAGLGSGEWRSSSECAMREFAVDDRTFRRWLADRDVRLPSAVRQKLLALAWAFAVEVKNVC